VQLELTAACPACGHPAEPEQDGDVIYFACPACEMEFGHHVERQGPVCAAGLPLAAPEPAGLPVIATTISMRRPE